MRNVLLGIVALGISSTVSAQVWNGDHFNSGSTGTLTVEVANDPQNGNGTLVTYTYEGSSGINSVGPIKGDRVVGPGGEIGTNNADPVMIGGKQTRIYNGKAQRYSPSSGAWVNLTRKKQEPPTPGKGKTKLSGTGQVAGVRPRTRL
jgi:hypothetical protein